SVEAPLPLARLRIIRVDEAPDAVFRAADSDDHLPLDHKWRDRGTVSQLVDIADFPAVVSRHGDRRIPDFLAGIAIEADEMGVQRRHVETVAPGAEATVDCVAAKCQVFGQ